MNIILSDKGYHKTFLPLTYTRSIADFRIGILTIKEKWEKYLGLEVGVYTEPYLQDKYPLKNQSKNLIINSTILPDKSLANEILNLKKSALVKKDTVIAMYSGQELDFDFFSNPENSQEYGGDIRSISSLPDIFLLNDLEIKSDFNLIASGRKSNSLCSSNTLIGDTQNIFIEEGAYVKACIINTLEGPVYIGKNAQIMEGTCIRGPLAVCENAVIKMGAKIYGATTIGSGCKVGGEINNSVFFANSNKAHDGYLGNSIIGEWCNLGADTNNSNLKNNYENVKIWSYQKKGFIDTGLQFCGLIMGDHSKSGINTMFNTGTVVGVSANIFGAGFPRNFIPSFSWGGHAGVKEYRLDKAIETMSKVLERRKLRMTETDNKIMNHIYNESAEYRR